MAFATKIKDVTFASDVQNYRLLSPSIFLYLLLTSYSASASAALKLSSLYLEVLDVSSLTANILLRHANIDVGRLLEELRSLAGIADDEQ